MHSSCYEVNQGQSFAQNHEGYYQKVLIFPDNAGTDTSACTGKNLRELTFEVLELAVYSSDPTPWRIHPFEHLKGQSEILDLQMMTR
jgi:hypothetical protein